MGRALQSSFQAIGPADEERHIPPVVQPALEKTSETLGVMRLPPFVQSYRHRAGWKGRTNTFAFRFQHTVNLAGTEIPGRPTFGPDLDQLERALARHASRVLFEACTDPIRHSVANRQDEQPQERKKLGIQARAFALASAGRSVERRNPVARRGASPPHSCSRL